MGRIDNQQIVVLASCLMLAGSVCAQPPSLPSWLTPEPVAFGNNQPPALIDVEATDAGEITPRDPAARIALQADTLPTDTLPADTANQQTLPAPVPATIDSQEDELVVGDVPLEWVGPATREASIADSMSRPTVSADAVRQLLRAQSDRSPIAPGYRPWWEPTATVSFELSESSVVVDGDSLILEALRHSYRISALNENISIARTGISRAASEFDPTAFVESKFIRTSVPTGSALDAGPDLDRLREEDFSFSGGMRRKTQSGAQFEIGQQIGLRDSSSEFFTPDNQGNSRLTLSFNQPLLSGAGKAYNRSLIILAKLDTQIAQESTTTSIQDHLLAVQESMWNLYYERASLILRIRHLEQARSVRDWLKKRQELDALDSQLKRADAAVAARQSELARAVTSIRNAEDQLRALVNSPNLSADKSIEIIPSNPPSLVHIPVSLEDAVVTALQQRSEVNEIARELDTARVRLNIAHNELMPMLDLVLESYVSGLRGGHDIGRSWIDQFSVGEPSYTAGLTFEIPLQRRLAKANVCRRQAELRKLSSRLSETIAKLHVEVASAVREVDTSYRELGARYVAMVAAQEYVDLIARRWRELPGDGFSANSLLEDLLDAQDRLLLEEVGFARAQIDYALSSTRLKRATGTLLQVQTPNGSF